MSRSNKIDMLQGPLLSKVLAFSVPLMLSGILQLLFNAADTVVVGRFAGSASLAAVGSTGSLINLFVNLLIGLSVGANVLIARQLGAGESTDRISRSVHTAIVLAFVGGAVIAVLGVAFAPALLRMMSTPEDIIGLAGLYLRIYFVGLPCSMLYNYGAAILRAQGDTKRPLLFLTVSGIINVLLNLAFVILLKMDVAGVALATILSQTVSAVLVMLCLAKESGPLHFSWKKLCVDTNSLAKMCQVGLPAGLQGMLFSLSNVVIQGTINGFGSIVVAGNSAAASIEGFVYVAMNAFHQSCQTFTSQNFGAGSQRRANRVLYTCLLCVTVTGAVLGEAAIRCGPVLCGIYSTDAQVVAAGVARLSVVCRMYFLCGAMDVMVGSLRGFGYSVGPMLVSLMGACGLRLLWIAFLFPLRPTIDFLYLSYPVTWGITALTHMVVWVVVRRKTLGGKQKALPT